MASVHSLISHHTSGPWRYPYSWVCFHTHPSHNIKPCSCHTHPSHYIKPCSCHTRPSHYIKHCSCHTHFSHYIKPCSFHTQSSHYIKPCSCHTHPSHYIKPCSCHTHPSHYIKPCSCMHIKLQATTRLGPAAVYARVLVLVKQLSLVCVRLGLAGQNCIQAPHMTVCLVISFQKYRVHTPYMYRIYTIYIYIYNIYIYIYIYI